jgi:hypothetical protein
VTDFDNSQLEVQKKGLIEPDFIKHNLHIHTPETIGVTGFQGFHVFNKVKREWVSCDTKKGYQYLNTSKLYF